MIQTTPRRCCCRWCGCNDINHPFSGVWRRDETTHNNGRTGRGSASPLRFKNHRDPSVGATYMSSRHVSNFPSKWGLGVGYKSKNIPVCLYGRACARPRRPRAENVNRQTGRWENGRQECRPYRHTPYKICSVGEIRGGLPWQARTIIPVYGVFPLPIKWRGG